MTVETKAEEIKWLSLRELKPDKDGDWHKYFVRYGPGQEAEVPKALEIKVLDPNYDLGWWGAAALTYQLGRRLEVEMDELMKGS